MAKVHGAVTSGSYKAVTAAVALDTISAPASATAPSTSLSRPDNGEVERLMDAFRGCGGPMTSTESLLSEATLREVLKSAAVALPVLSPLQEPDMSSDEDDADVVADYATGDVVDETPTSEVMLKVRIQRTRTHPALPSSATSADARNPLKYGGKDLRPDMRLRAHVASWPTRLVTVPHADLVRALEALPESSSRCCGSRGRPFRLDAKPDPRCSSSCSRHGCYGAAHRCTGAPPPAFFAV